MQASFEKILRHLDEARIQPLIGLPIPIEEEAYEKILGKFRRWLKKIAKERSLKAIDFYSAFLDPKKKRPVPSYYEDGIHPSSKGYQAMAQAAVKVLRPLLG